MHLCKGDSLRQQHTFSWRASHERKRAHCAIFRHCHPDFANGDVAPRRMPQFSATSQTGLFQPSSSTVKSTTFAARFRRQKCLQNAADDRRPLMVHESALPPFCLRLAVRQKADLPEESDSANGDEQRDSRQQTQN